jgi:elongation factor 3
MPAAIAVAPSVATSAPVKPGAAVELVEGQIDVSSLLVADKATRAAAAKTLAALASQNNGPSTLKSCGFLDGAIQALADKKSQAAREGAVEALTVLVHSPAAVKALEPHFVTSGLFAALLEVFADKIPAIRTASVEVVRCYVSVMNPWATAMVLPALLRQIKTAGKWQIKIGALAILNQLVTSAPVQTARMMTEIVPVLAETIWDTKTEVKNAARKTLTNATALVSNKDIERFIPALIKALINPVEEVPNTIQLLSSTTFVSEVDTATLSLMVPLLSRGLSEKLTATKRKVAVYVPSYASSFSPISYCAVSLVSSTTCPN